MWYGEAKRIYLLPLGEPPEALLEIIKEKLEEKFAKDAEISSPLPLPEYAYNPDRQQCNSTTILERLKEKDARSEMGTGMVLAVIDADLYANGLNFVFGEADPVEGAAVISLARLREEFYGKAENWELLIERAVKEAVHEIGHLYGFSHCPEKTCAMHFSNSLADTDVKSSDICCSCRARLLNP